MEWISVKDRLPEEDTVKVLVYIQTETEDWVDVASWYDAFCCSIVFAGDYVTHWMPLPEPPKENP